jgi:TonB family protein
MDERFRRSLKNSTIAHFVVLLIAIIAPLIFNWRTNKKRKEIVTIVEFTVALPEAAAPEPVREFRAPEPPKPPPKPVVPDIPEPAKEPAKPKPKVERSEKKITRPAPKPQTPPLSAEEIKKLLAAGAKISDKTSIPPDLSSLSWYYAVVRQTMYDAWTQPGGLARSAGIITKVEIRVQRDGTIIRRRMIQSSGNSVMDDSVMRAVESVSRLRPLPAEVTGAHHDITIEFELAGGVI